MAGRSDLQTPHPDFFVNAFDPSEFGRSGIVALPNSEDPTRSGLIFQPEGGCKRTTDNDSQMFCFYVNFWSLWTSLLLIEKLLRVFEVVREKTRKTPPKGGWK
jgi:hypothetical protein